MRINLYHNNTILKFNLETILIGIFLLTFFILPASFNSVIIIIIAATVIINGGKFKIQMDFVVIMIIIYIIYNLISLIYAKNINLTIKETITWIMFLIAMCISKNISIFETKLRDCLLGGIIFLNVIYIVQNYLNLELAVIRIPTINCAAIINCLAIIFMENQIFLRKVNNQLVLRLIQMLCLFSILIGNVRGVVVILALYYVYFVFYRQMKKKNISALRKLVSIMCILCIVAIVVYMLPRFWTDYASQMQNLFSLDVYSNRVRVLLYGQAIEYTYHHNVLFGIGSGNFVEYYDFFRVMGLSAEHAHSIFIQPFVELGIVGFILVILMFFGFFKNAQEVSKQNRCMYLELIAAFSIYGMIDYVWVDLRVGIFFFIIIGQMMREKYIKEKKIENEKV